MKTFINKTAIIFFTFSIAILLLVFLIHFTTKHTANFNVNQNTKYLVMGHSHPECAFNDEFIENFKNLSSSGESYFYTYQKIKEIIPNNNINGVFIEYTNNQIRTKLDEWIWGYEKMNANFPWHSSFMNKDDIEYLYTKNLKDFPKAISTSTRNNLTRILSLDFISTDIRYGGYKKLTTNIDKSKLINDINNNAKDTIDEIEISTENLKYLEKIIDYCNINNVKVFLIRSPQHKYYKKENEKELTQLKKRKFANLDFLDFDKFPLEDNKFADFGHLNYEGSKKFSLWFNDLIKNGLLSIENKTDFINKEMKEIRELNNLFIE